MFGWLIILVVIGGVIGFAYGLGKKGKEGAAEGAIKGAFSGGWIFFTILMIILPWENLNKTRTYENTIYTFSCSSIIACISFKYQCTG